MDGDFEPEEGHGEGDGRMVELHPPGSEFVVGERRGAGLTKRVIDR